MATKDQATIESQAAANPPIAPTPTIPPSKEFPSSDESLITKANPNEPIFQVPDFLKDLRVRAAKVAEEVKSGEEQINTKVVQPFRQGLDVIGSDLEKYATDNPNLTPVAKGMVYGLGALTKAAPVGENIRETIGMNIAPPEFGEGGVTGGMKGDAEALQGLRSRPAPEPTIVHEPIGNEGGLVKLMQGDKEVGRVRYTIPEEGKTGAITASHVDPAYSGQGHGQKMYLRVADELKAKGIPEMTSDLKGTTSFDAGRVWDKLTEKGHPIEKIPSKAGSPGYKMDLTKQQEEPDIFVAAKKKYGQKLNYDDIDHNSSIMGYFLPDGSFVGYTNAKAAGDKTHSDMALDVMGRPKDAPTHSDIAQQRQTEFQKAGAIRMFNDPNQGAMIDIGSNTKPTPEQIQEIAKFTKSVGGKVTYELPGFGHGGEGTIGDLQRAIDEHYSPKNIIERQGLKYKGELVPGSKVHMFEHPDHPGKTAALHESQITPEDVSNKMQSKLDEFSHKQTASESDSMDNPAVRFAASKHEAGHTVVSESLQPGSVAETGLTYRGGVTNVNAPKGKTKLSQLSDEEVTDALATSLAGGLTEEGGTTRGHSSADERLRARIIGSLDSLPIQNLSRLATGKVSGPDMMVNAPKLQAAARAKVEAVLADPRAQEAISGLAEKLFMEKSHMTGKEIRDYLKSVPNK